MDTKTLVEQRGELYGTPREDFTRTAAMWSAYLGTTVVAEDVPMLMILLKVSRQRHKHNPDNLADIKGYALTREMLELSTDLNSEL